jgi:putative DNA primase/helicase
MEDDITVEDLPAVLHAALSRDKTAAADLDMIRRMACAYVDEPRVWLQCKEVLKGFRGILKEIEKRVILKAREISDIPSIGGPPPTERTVIEIWDGAPCTDDVYAPTGYKIHAGRPAIERIEKKTVGDMPYEKKIAVSLDPLLVTRRIGHIQAKSLMLELQFRTDKGWRKVVEDREILLNSRKIVDVARFGLPVGSDNALEVVSWIRHYETQNRDRIPMAYASSAMGWQGEEDNPTHHGFLCGLRQVGGNGRAIELEGGDGDMDDARKIREHGSFEAWQTAVARIAHFPAIRLGICASLAAPLIAILDAPNSIVEWAGRTSRGKSTVLQIAQSCWRSTADRLRTWNSTVMGVEAAAQHACDLPLIVDDTKTAMRGGRSQDLERVVYQLISGRARGRATRDGTQKARPSWRTIVLSSGEAPLGELCDAEGAAARILTFWSTPLGSMSKDTRALALSVVHDLSIHYGHAGPRIVKWLCDNRQEWDMLRRFYETTMKRVGDGQTDLRPAASRLASVVALLECSAYVSARAGVTPWQKSLLDDTECIANIDMAMSLADETADRAYQAWCHVMSVADSLPNAWISWDRDPDPERDPPGGWLGVRRADEFGWYPNQLKKVLKQGEFEIQSVLRAWRDLEILVSANEGFISRCRPYGGREKARLIRVARRYPDMPNDDDDFLDD